MRDLEERRSGQWQVWRCLNADATKRVGMFDALRYSFECLDEYNTVSSNHNHANLRLVWS